jgi:hypothetical protein
LKELSHLVIAAVDLDKTALLQEADRQDQSQTLKMASKVPGQKLNQNLVRLEAQTLETAPAVEKAKAKL